jgi:hypothetical protein
MVSYLTGLAVVCVSALVFGLWRRASPGQMVALCVVMGCVYTVIEFYLTLHPA